MNQQANLCENCLFFNDKVNKKFTCSAFPDGIPEAIVSGFDHNFPYYGDNDIRFRPKKYSNSHVCHFQERYEKFPVNFNIHFDSFWRWKNNVEKEGFEILDDKHIGVTFEKLKTILSKWKCFRNAPGGEDGIKFDRWGMFKESLINIRDSYDAISDKTLLNLYEIDTKTLNVIWNEFGKVKEPAGAYNDANEYYIISICKPLMIIWGQTLAFDTIVRKEIQHDFRCCKNNYRWEFEDWLRVLIESKKFLEENPELCRYFQDFSIKKYGKSSIVPYGRFLDIKYFERKQTCWR